MNIWNTDSSILRNRASRSGRNITLTFAIAAALSLSIAGAQAQTTLAVGDIQIVGVTSDANDSFSFVLWKDIASGTVIRFMDQSFTNAATGVLGTETDMSLTFSSALTSGTVIRVEDTGVTLVNGVAFSGTKAGSLSGVAASGDQVFIYQGTAIGSGTDFTGRTLLYGFNIADTNWVASAPDSNKSFLPTAISGLDASIDSGNFDNADYSGTRSGMTTAAYRAAIANIANYAQSDTRSDLGTDGFTTTSSIILHWDANGTTVGNGGAGTWDATTQSLFKNGASGTTYLHWVNSSTGNEQTAVFGGTAGTVSVAASGVTASGMQFDVSGYTIQNNTINLFGSTPTFSVTTAGHTATVSSVLAGSTGLTKSGAGTLILSGVNTFTGGTTLSGGTLVAGNNSALGNTGAQTVTFDGGKLASDSDARSLPNNFTINNVAGNQITGANSMTLTGTASGAGTLEVALTNTAKSVTVNPATENTFAPDTLRLTSGTLVLGDSYRLGDSTKLNLNGGTFGLNNFSEGTAGAAGLGSMLLSANSSIDYGTFGGGANILAFGGVGSHTSATTLQILNFDIGSDHLYFSGATGDFTGAFSQGEISFNGLSGYSAISYGSYFEIVPVPEPGTVAGALGLLIFVGYRERRRLRHLCKRHVLPSLWYIGFRIVTPFIRNAD